MAFQTRLTPELVERYRGRGDWREETFFDLLSAQAARVPDKTALVDRFRRVGYGALKRDVERMASALKAQGLGRGDVLTVQLPNWIDFAHVFFAAELIGAVVNKVNPDFRAREMEFILAFSESKGWIAPVEFRGFDYPAMMRGLAPKLPGLRLLGLVGDAVPDGFVDLRAELARAAPLPAAERVRMSADEVCRMAFTSGTTGDPKSVLHSFNTTLPALRHLTRDMRATEQDVFLIWLPIGLNWGYLVLTQALALGATVVLLDRFGAEAALELIERERASFIPTAPASIVAILNSPKLATTDVSSLRVVITGGASCPVETLRAFQRSVPSARLIELYGMLETGYHTYTRLDDDAERVNGTIGRCVEGMGLRLLDEAGNDVAKGAQGEIACEGPSVHLGYHKNPSANAELFTADGWFRTGDLGEFADAAGNVRIVGRRKEIINRGGKKFFPREIEELLYAHPKVLHAAMVGVTDPRLGERNCLCLIPKEGQSATLEEFVEFLKGEVATYKLPEMLELFEELPFTPTGKLRRHVLAEWVERRRAGAAA
jgi:non-ribosomal peptide synthetase component E (peptide arylation enzyme)